VRDLPQQHQQRTGPIDARHAGWALAHETIVKLIPAFEVWADLNITQGQHGDGIAKPGQLVLRTLNSDRATRLG